MAFRRCSTELTNPGSEQPAHASREYATCGRDPVYLFACLLEWRDRGNLLAYHELTAALNDPDEGIRAVAEALLRISPRRQADERTVEAW